MFNFLWSFAVAGRNKNQGQGGPGFQGYYGQGSYGRGAESETWGEYDGSGDDYEVRVIIHTGNNNLSQGSAEDYDNNYTPPCVGQ